MRTSTRWTLAVLVIAAAIVAALLTQLHSPEAGPRTSTPSVTADRPASTPQTLDGPRRLAALAPCPAGSGDTPRDAPLAPVVVECAADGSEVQVGRALAGRTTVLNLWAYWCGPCAHELPAMADYQRRAGDTVDVVTVHQDPDEAAGLSRLADLGVTLPTLQDGDRRIAAALKVPNVMPATVVLRADGTVAGILPRAFDDADDIAAAVRDSLR